MPVHQSSSPTHAKEPARDSHSTSTAATETPQPEFAMDTFITHAQTHQPKTPRVTSTNIMALQRSIGNQAVQRLIRRQKGPATSPAVVATLPQATMPAGVNPLLQAGAGRPAGLTLPAGGVFTIQRLVSKEFLKKRGSPDSKGGSYKNVLNLVDDYNKKLDQKVQITLAERTKKADSLYILLDNIVKAANSYLMKHTNKTGNKDKDRVLSFNSFERLVMEVELEKEDLSAIVNSSLYNIRDIKNNNTWEEALTLKQQPMGNQTNKNQKIAKIVNLFGFPIDYVKTLDHQTLSNIIKANNDLAAGDLGEADKALTLLKGLPTYDLIKSALLRHNIGKVNPELDKLVSNPKFEQKAGPKADIGYKAMFGDQMGKAPAKALESFTAGLGKAEDLANFEHTEKEHRDKGVENYASNLKNRQEWEKKVDLNPFKNLKHHEGIAISAYSTDFKSFNDPLRGDITPKGFKKENMGMLENLVSALNKLPPYLGTVFRHDADFPGFKELNQVGATVTDLGLTSTTREANTLKLIKGSKLPDVLTVIQSKTGRFIKPGSDFNNLMMGDENEVLFKPGVKFRVTKRVDARTVGEKWPADMDNELKTALDQDQEKPRMKMVLKKEEV